jgi:hypothetical protein
MEGAELLGASAEIANDLLPYALAAHARMVKLYSTYPLAEMQAPRLGASHDAGEVKPVGAYEVASAFCLSASNSPAVIAPLSRSSLPLAIWSAGSAWAATDLM